MILRTAQTSFFCSQTSSERISQGAMALTGYRHRTSIASPAKEFGTLTAFRSPPSAFRPGRLY